MGENSVNQDVCVVAPTTPREHDLARGLTLAYNTLLDKLGMPVELRYSVILDTKEAEVLNGRKWFAEAKTKAEK